jgi:lipopolysaccharide export system protein LptC
MQSVYNKRVIILFVLALAAFLSWWLSSTGPSLLPRTEIKRHDPDYYLINFILTTMNDSGVPKHRLSADNMYHYPDDDTASLVKPDLVIYHNNSDSWEIRADLGHVSEGGKSVLLQGDVFINQLDVPADMAMEIVTRDVDVKPEEETASTEQAIVIKSRYGVTEGVGMQANLKERQLHLLSQVRGNYKPVSN